MFLTTDNRIMWRKMGLGAIVVLVFVLLGIVWFDEPLFLELRKLDCKLFHVFAKVFDAKIWIMASLITAILFCTKKCVKIDCSFLDFRNKKSIKDYVYNFFVKTKGSNAFLIFYSVLSAGVLVKVLKVLIGRARPIFFEALDMTGFFPPSFDWAFNSMPSGHTAVSFAGLVMIGMLAPKFKPLTWTLAILIGVSRVAVGAHWPSDVIFGAFVGMVVADIVKWYLLRKIAK